MSLTALSAFGPDNSVHVVVESPRGSTVKLKYDASLNAFTLAQPLIEGLAYRSPGESCRRPVGLTATRWMR